MISSGRTYRTVSVVAALALLLSVSAPLVRYACGAAGKAMTTLPVASSAEHEAHGSAVALCGHAHGDLHAALCTNSQHEPSGCEDASCTVESEKPESALIVEGPAVRLDLAPALIVEQILPLVFSSRPAFQWGSEAVGAHSLVPIRLLTSTFLL